MEEVQDIKDSPEERKWTVYIHRNMINNKAYIGITSNDVKKRWKYGKGYECNKHFSSSIKKYGWNNFEHIIWAKDLSESDAKHLEKLLIALFDTTNLDKGYNQSTGGEGASGIKRSEETRQKLSRVKKGKYVGKLNPNYGNHFPEEAKKKLSEERKGIYAGDKNPMYGRPWWDENTPQEKIDRWKTNISKRTTGENNPNYGVICTEEKKEKLLNSNPNKKSVIHIGINGEILGEYRSKREANRVTGVRRQTLELYCDGKRTPSDGTSWMFKVEYDEFVNNLNSNLTNESICSIVTEQND